MRHTSVVVVALVLALIVGHNPLLGIQYNGGTDTIDRFFGHGTCSIRAWVFSGSSVNGTYAAIAYSRSTEALGWANGYSTQLSAEAKARHQCGRSDCQTAVWVRNAYAAFAHGERGLGSAWASSRETAERQALRACAEQD